MWYGLCDCNSFYASCERLYRPDLAGKPVVVLSNNDGIIVALTQEAKAVGLKRGDALFKVRQIVEQNHVAVFSSNYPLYQDISDGVMATLKSLVGDVEQYSIDESFFTVGKASQTWCENLHEKMVRYTGMPVAVGVGRTRTLAKAGENLYKHTKNAAILVTKELEEDVLKHTEIGDVWGIGWRNGPRLKELGIRTAWDLTRMDDFWIRKKLGIGGIKTVQELRGVPVIDISEPQRRSLASGISFGKAMTSKEELKEAASCHAMTLSEKLSQHHLEALTLTFMAFTDRFKPGFITPMGTLALEHPTSYAPAIASGCRLIIDRIWRPGRYKGCRIWAVDLIPEGDIQLSLGEGEEQIDRLQKREKMTEVVQSLHRRYGRMGITIASTGIRQKADLMTQSQLSPRYTTRIDDIPEANASRIARAFHS